MQNSPEKALPDIYYDPSYAALYETVENGVCERFAYSSQHGAVLNVFMKRPVPWTIDGEQFYDIVTPYGYGGPVVLWSVDKTTLLEDYWQAWQAYCISNKIVCEFVRFHPLLNNQQDFAEKYNAVYNRHTLAVHLTEDFFMTQFHSKCRNAIRKAEKLGIACEIDETCESIDEFAQIYYKTMEKDHADAYYYFPMDYFHQMRQALFGRLILINAKLENKTIASSLFMLSDSYIHYHLSATDPAYYQFAANNLVLKVASEWGLKHNKKWLHLGGGLTSSEEDSLFKFKRSFAREDQNLKEFWLGRAIYIRKAYDDLVALRQSEGSFDIQSSFFPLYRTPSHS